MNVRDSASKIVPEQVVEAACLEIGQLSEDQARLPATALIFTRLRKSCGRLGQLSPQVNINCN